MSRTTNRTSNRHLVAITSLVDQAVAANAAVAETVYRSARIRLTDGIAATSVAQWAAFEAERFSKVAEGYMAQTIDNLTNLNAASAYAAVAHHLAAA